MPHAVSPEVAKAGLRALKTIAMSDGVFHTMEREIIESVQKHLLQTDFDIDALEPIDADQLAEAVRDPQQRRRIVGSSVVISLIDGVVDSREEAQVQAYADALDVEEPAIKDMKRYGKRRLFAMRVGILRRFTPAILLRQEWKERGLRGLARFIKQVLQSEDPRLAAKYKALEKLPEGTLGREYFEFAKQHGLQMPGEKGAPPEMIVFHDCNHVLAEYGTTPEEESQIAAFHAGYHRVEPFGMLIFSIAQFHLGVRVAPVNEGYSGLVDPELLVKAFARGTEVKVDLFEAFNPQEEFETPVTELRERFGIPPRT